MEKGTFHAIIISPEIQSSSNYSTAVLLQTLIVFLVYLSGGSACLPFQPFPLITSKIVFWYTLHNFLPSSETDRHHQNTWTAHRCTNHHVYFPSHVVDQIAHRHFRKNKPNVKLDNNFRNWNILPRIRQNKLSGVVLSAAKCQKEETIWPRSCSES